MACKNTCLGRLDINARNAIHSGTDSKKVKMSNTLDILKNMTTVVADTGDFECKYIHFKYKLSVLV